MIELVRKIILDVVEINCNKCGKKSRESNSHFLDVFLIFLKDFTKWKCLDYCTFTKYKSDNYRKKFIYWTRCHVFSDALDIINSIVRSKFVNKRSINVFVDGTNIRNINGSYKRNRDTNGETLLGRLYCDKFKRGLKVTILITDKNDLLDVTVSNGGKHDVVVIPTIYKRLKSQFKSNRNHRINIIGDKGYQSSVNKKKFNKIKMNYITPQKKYKNRPTEKIINDQLLKQRYLIEHYFAHLKQLTRIRFMYDKLIYIYIGFLQLGVLFRVKDIK